MSNLVKYSGYKFSAKIKWEYCTGELYYEDGTLFLLQDVKDGMACHHKTDYEYSWCIGKGTSSDLAANNVTELTIIVDSSKKLNISEFVVGDYVSVIDGLSSFNHGGSVDKDHKYGKIAEAPRPGVVHVRFNAGDLYAMDIKELIKSNITEYHRNERSSGTNADELEFKSLKTFKL